MNPPPPPAASQPRLQPNDVVENPTGDTPQMYRVVRLVGIGGMGAVYEAIRKSTLERVALKEILFNPDELEANYFQKLQSAFLKEARILINMNRTNFPEGGATVPQAYDIFRANGIWYLVMEFIEGKTLSELIGSGEQAQPLPAEEVTKWGIQLALTLEFLHQQTPPLIHADIKPSNIKISPNGQSALLDFGIAKGGYGYPSVPFTRGTIRFATPYYAAPEQFRAQALSPATDVFALAATLYHAVTGERPPKVDERLYALALDQRGDPLRAAHIVNPLVPRWMSQILAQGMSLEVLQRPTNAAQFRTMLEQQKPDSVVDMAGVSDMWGKPASRFGDDNRMPSPRVASDKVPSDKVRSAPVRSDKVPSKPVRSDPVRSNPVRSNPVRQDEARDYGGREYAAPPPSLRPAAAPIAAPPPPRSGGINVNMLVAIGLLGAAVLLLLVLPFLPTTDVTTQNGTGGTGTTPTVVQSGGGGTEDEEDTETVIPTSTAEPTELPTAVAEPTIENTPEVEPTAPPIGPAPTSTRLQVLATTAPRAPTEAPVASNPTGGTSQQLRPTATPPEIVFTIPTAAPSIRLVSPAADAAFSVQEPIRFDWAWGGSLQGTQYYDLRIWREGSPHRGVADFRVLGGTFNPAGLGSGVYYWSVAVVDAGGQTTIAPEAPPRRIYIN